MTLARDVPTKLASALPAFVTALLDRARLPKTRLDQAVFALHPGGPKIIDQIATALSLTEPQVAFSRAVLRARGNMSSATLPHVWQAIALSRDVPPDAIVVSLAFGPGLTLAGSVGTGRAKQGGNSCISTALRKLTLPRATGRNPPTSPGSMTTTEPSARRVRGPSLGPRMR